MPPQRRRDAGRGSQSEPEDPPALSVESTDDLIALLEPIMKAVAEAVGPHCEVVLHDLANRDLDQTLVAIENGHVTGREVGGPSTNLGLELLRNEELRERDHNEFGYVARTNDGRDVRSSVVYLRDGAGKVVAAFAVNVDLTPLQAARESLDRLLPSPDAQRVDEVFATDITEVLDNLIESAISRTGKSVALMDKTEKMQVLEFLDEKGAFFVKRAVERVSRRLGVSRVTAYNYLEQIRNR